MHNNIKDTVSIKNIFLEGLVDPGFTLWKAETLKDLGTCQMNLAR